VTGWRAWVPALLWAAVLFAASSRSTLPGDLGGGVDKLAHFGAYAVLGVLLAWAAVASRWSIAWPVLIGLAYAASDEIHQYFVPGRSSDAGDWLADALGVGAGCLLVYRVLSGRLRQRAPADDVSAGSVSP
jgi:VanZ family protein